MQQVKEKAALILHFYRASPAPCRFLTMQSALTPLLTALCPVKMPHVLNCTAGPPFWCSVHQTNFQCNMVIAEQLCVICRVIRHQEGEAVGAVCLNLTKCPGLASVQPSNAEQSSPFGQALASALRFLGGRCVELPLHMPTVSAIYGCCLCLWHWMA